MAIFRVSLISYTSMMSYNNVMKMLFLNNFSLMNSIKEELILHIMWTVTFLLVTCKFINENRKIKPNKPLFQVTASWMDYINIILGSGK